MKIVYFIEDITETGGVERTITQKASCLCEKYGYDVTIISAYDNDGKIHYNLSPKVKLMSLGVSRITERKNKLGVILSRFGIFRNCVTNLNRLLKDIQPDIVSFVWVLGAMTLPFTHTKARKIYESHSSRKNTPYKPLLWLMERNADCIVSLTSDDATQFSHCSDIRAIPNYISIPECVVEDYSVKRVVAMGRLIPVKGFSRLLKMWKKILEDNPGWILDIYGVGPLNDSLQQEIECLGLSHSAHLMGRTENVSKTYLNYSIHVMTSHAEGQGMVMMEAQACGLPSVTFNFEYGAADIITDGDNGYIVSQDDEDAFCGRLSLLMQSESLRRELGQRGRRVMMDKFTSEKIMPQWDALFNSLANGMKQ